MESTTRLGSPGHAGWRQGVLLALVALLAIGMIDLPAARAQDAVETQDVVIPGTGDEGDAAAEATSDAALEEAPTEAPEPEPTEPAETPPPAAESALVQISATDPGNPAVIAHGLAFLTGEQTVWQVREVEPDGGDQAVSVLSNAAFVYQVQGTSIVRNEVTGKRALLDPGEAFFKAGGDAYTTFGNSDDSLVWIFEVVGPSEVEADAFYESPLIDDYQEGVFDLLLVRYVLEPGESVTLPDHTGPALVMSASGDIDVESGGLGLLSTGQGQLVTEEATVTNSSANPVVFVMPAFGAGVDDATSSPGAASLETTDDAATDGDTAEPDAAPADDASADETTEEPAAEETPVPDDSTSTDSGNAAAGGSQTSINITALADLYVVVAADGVTVFDGPIPEGGQSGVIVGSTFDVYTSYGAGTIFSNACGEEFVMGYEEGEANYTLTANPESCAP